MRKRHAVRRLTDGDPRFNDEVVAKFINCVLRRGKKHLARRIVYDAFTIVEQRTKTNGLDVFRKAINNMKPVLEVRARRVGGATYQVPTEVRPGRGVALAFRWLITFARQRKDKSLSLKLASEMIAAANNEGSAIKKKEDTHKMAEANKAFAHFRW